MAIFEGAGVALVTPFTESGEVNYPKLKEIVEEQIAGGTDAIIACGTTGESATMSHEEHLDVIRYVCEVVNHRIPVIAGTGSNSTKEAIHLSQGAEKAGADGLLLVTPYYNKATQNGLIAHYTAIANSVSLPILLYHVPSRTGVTMKPQLADGCVDLYSGNDDQIVPLLSLGGKGVISVLSNVAPRQTHDICASFFEGDVKKSCEMQLKAIPVINALFCEVNPIPVKAAMNMMGKEVGPLRLPLTEMEPQNKERLKKAMEEYGIL